MNDTEPLSLILNPEGLDTTRPIWCIYRDSELIAMFHEEEQAKTFVKLWTTQNQRATRRSSP